MTAPILNAVILTEAGSGIGLGHLARCVGLFDALEECGCACEIVVAGDAPSHIVGNREAHSMGWRAEARVAEVVGGNDIAVVDSYEASRAIYEAIAGTVPVVVYLDDYDRLPYPPGIVVNGSRVSDARVRDRHSGSTALLGTQYQLLRSPFWSVPERSVRAEVRRILLLSGGADAGAMREVMASILRVAYPDVLLDVADSPRNAEAIRDAMLAADVAVTAAGQTLYELAASGTPAVAVCVADNQIPQARELEHAGVLQLAGVWGDPEVPARVVRLLEVLWGPRERAAMAAAGRRLVDGAGARRVALTCVAAALDQTVALRFASPTDEALLLELANDPVVRRASFSDAAITAEEHHRWLVERLADQHTVLLVARRGHDLVGQVRFQIEHDRAVVSISLAERYRGLGFAERLLARATDTFRSARPAVGMLVARAKVDNAASLRLFESAGYHRVGSVQGSPDAVELARRIS